jgi:hypothetical protein
MRYRKKVRDDVRAELAAHFEDELRDCKTDEEKEQKAKKLIEDFGDAKLLAVLLRRAKKRCRPLWRKTLVRVFTVLALTFCYLFICWARLLIGTPTIKFEYAERLNEIVAGPAESENARKYYDKAAKLYVECPNTIARSVCADINELDDLTMKELITWLADNQAAFEMLMQGTKKPYCWTVYSDNDSHIPEFVELPKEVKNAPVHKLAVVMQNSIQYLPFYRKIAKAILWQIKFDLKHNNFNEAIDNIAGLQRFAIHLQGKGLLVEQISGIGIERNLADVIFCSLQRTNFQPDTLKTLKNTLKGEYKRESKIISLSEEKAMWDNIVQWAYTDNGKGSGRLLGHGVPFVVGNWQDSLMSFFFFGYPNRQQFVSRIEESYNLAGELFEKTPWQVRAQGRRQEWDKLGNCSLMLSTSMHHYQYLWEFSWQLKAERLGLLTTLAILTYEKQTGAFPDSIDELVKNGYLSQFPMDPFSDKPIVYKRTEDNFILYSVSMNFTDDGGKVEKNDKGEPMIWGDQGDAVFWPVNE